MTAEDVSACTCKTDAEIGLCEKPCTRDVRPTPVPSKEQIDRAWAEWLQNTAVNGRGNWEAFCAGFGYGRRATPETTPQLPIPELLGKAWERIGFLEECLRHINDVATRKRASVVCAQVPVLALGALQAGDPLTCPEARQVKTTPNTGE